MKKNIFLILLLILFCSFKVDRKGPWIITEGRQVIVYSRPANHSKSHSPDSVTIQKIIHEQEEVIVLINKKLKTNFDEKIKIYLFNLDEAKEKIGTNSGGGCDFKKKIIYFSFRNTPIYNTIRKGEEYIGVHEMVHIITNNELGTRTTRFFGEGYSNGVDGNYGAIMQGNQLVFRRNDSTLVKIRKQGKFLKPSELLDNNKIAENLYYPQAGCLIDWLFKTYGVEKINRLYPLKEDQIVKKFQKVTGDTFLEMEKKYLESNIKNE